MLCLVFVLSCKDPGKEVLHYQINYICTLLSKLDISSLAYRDENGKPWVLPAVREAEKRLAADSSLNHEYFPILGYEPFCQSAIQLLFGEHHPVLQENRVIQKVVKENNIKLRIIIKCVKCVIITCVAEISRRGSNHKFLRATYVIHKYRLMF